MRTLNKRAVIVGVFIFLGLAFLIGGILTIGNLHDTFVKKIMVTTIFDDVNGLQPGNNVWFSAVKIGTVTKMVFFGKSQVKVTVKIDEKSQQYIRKDAKVKISSDGLIGNKIIVIYGGTSAAREVEDGDTLGIEKTLTTEDMMNTFQENNKNLLAITTDFKTISQKIARGEGAVGKLLNDETLYNNIDMAVASLQKASKSTQQLTAALSEYGAKLNQRGTLANDLVTDTLIFKNLNATVIKLQQAATNAAELTADFKRSSNNTNTPIGVLLSDEQTATNLKSTISNLDSSTRTLNEDLEALQHSFLLRGYFKKKEKAISK
ncbi:MAG: MlaD family protein [Chitinophagales bacterium]|nr:MlaD family protein [Chitinophagales bacterium]